MFSVKHISKQFGSIVALSDVSVVAKPHSITGIIGPNGCGKSTLLAIASSMLQKDAGFISIGDSYSRTFQDSGTSGHMNVLDTLLVALGERNPIKALLQKRRYEQRAYAALEEMHLTHLSDVLIQKLSYGQRKLVDFARATSMDPDVLFLDEPFAGVSATNKEHMKECLEELKSNGKTIVLVAHDFSLVQELCDYVYVLSGGMNLTEGAANTIFSNPAVIRAYLEEPRYD